LALSFIVPPTQKDAELDVMLILHCATEVEIEIKKNAIEKNNPINNCLCIILICIYQKYEIQIYGNF